jgi:hypothetical protein
MREVQEEAAALAEGQQRLERMVGATASERSRAGLG